MNRTRTRVREPRHLHQIPVWDGFEPPATPASVADPGGLGELLDGLDPDQRRAVTHGEGPLLVVAGAGTGKTQVITRRIAWLIATRRAAPSEILALTFTDKAAEEMQVRVDQLVPYGYADTRISTFHAFGDRLIREFALELGLPTDLRVLTRAETVVFLRERLFELGLEAYRPLGDPTRFLGALATLFARAKDEDVPVARYLELADRLEAEAAEAVAALAAAPDPGEQDRLAVAAHREDAGKARELARAYRRYTELLAAHGSIDFGDQVALALRLLRESPSVRARVAARYRYILVDEFQDTNRAQSELVALLASEHRNLTVVGDDDQSIYRFRGAAISNILEFRDRYRGARTVVLRRNYRSQAPVLDAAYRLIRFNDPDRLESRVGISKRLVPQRGRPDAPPVRHHAFASGAEEADWVAAEIARRIAAGARPRDHAVLVRANGDAEPVLRSLNLAGVPWRFSGSSGLYARPEVRLLLSVLRVIADPGSSTDLYTLATDGPFPLPGEDLTAVMAAARRRHRSAWEILEEAETNPGAVGLSAAGRTAVARFVTEVRRLRDLAHARPAGEVLYVFLRDSGLLARLTAGETVAAEEALANVARFFELVRSRSALLPDDRVTFLVPHLSTLIEAGDDPATADVDPDLDAVAVLTVHKAKGLEFGTVFLPGLVAGRFPSSSRREPLALPDALVDGPLAAAATGAAAHTAAGAEAAADAHTAEERRLFYVAMTRARDELILSHAADYGGARSRRVSPFVLEALDLPAVAATGGRGAVLTGPLDRIEAAGPPTVPPDPERRPIEGPLTLSHSSIDEYLGCPARYRLSHVVRVPTAPHHALVYGSALHKAVQAFHQAQAEGRTLSESELGTAFDAAWTNEGFVSREHEQARHAAGLETLRRFRTSQIGPGTVVPTWVEREFSFVLGGDRIRGRFDRVDIVPIAPGPAPATGAAPVTEAAAGTERSGRPDVSEPTFGLFGPELVTITDYKSGDVSDPAKARQKARDSLQLQIYALAYEALTGRLPDALQLHFLDTGLVGRIDVETSRLDKARERIATAAAGIRARDYTPKPDVLGCTYCPYRDICPASAAR